MICNPARRAINFNQIRFKFLIKYYIKSKKLKLSILKRNFFNFVSMNQRLNTLNCNLLHFFNHLASLLNRKPFLMKIFNKIFMTLDRILFKNFIIRVFSLNFHIRNLAHRVTEICFPLFFLLI
jgi:hypothetical protein